MLAIIISRLRGIISRPEERQSGCNFHLSWPNVDGKWMLNDPLCQDAISMIASS